MLWLMNLGFAAGAATGLTIAVPAGSLTLTGNAPAVVFASPSIAIPAGALGYTGTTTIVDNSGVVPVQEEDVESGVFLGTPLSYFDYVLGNGPTGFWPMMELRASTGARDYGSGGNDGTYTGTVNFGDGPGPYPHGGTVCVFNGVTGHVDFGDLAAMEISGAFSLVVIVKTVSTTNSCIVSKREDDGTGGWGLFMRANGHARMFADASGGAVIMDSLDSDGTVLNDGSYHMILVVADGTTGLSTSVKIYIDGVLYQQHSRNAGTIGGSAARFIIGAQDNGSGIVAPFAGVISGVAFWPAAFSDPAATAETFHTATQWQDIGEDVLVRPEPIAEIGIDDSSPLTRTASTGTFRFSLNNSELNSVGLVGRYSPHHENCFTNFTYDVPVKWVITAGGQEYPRFWGRLKVIDPMPGSKRSRHTNCTAVDYMDMLARQDVRQIGPQLNQDDDELIKAVLESLSPNAQPLTTDINAGVDTYPYAFHDLGNGTKALTALNYVVMSSWGLAWTSTQGVFCYRNRTSLAATEVTYTIDDDAITDLAAASDREQAFDHILVMNHPKSISAITQILYTHSGTPFLAANGGTMSFFADYRSPDNDLRLIGQISTETPAPTTDFLAWTNPDGTGTNHTASVTVTAEFFTTTAKLTLTNNHATDGVYFTFLQLRGTGVYDLTPVTYEAKESDWPTKPLSIDQRYQDDGNVSQEIADYVLAERAAFVTQVEAVEVVGNRSEDLMDMSLTDNINFIMSVSESVTGLHDAQAAIRSLQTVIQNRRVVRTTFGLTLRLEGNPWILGVSQLDIDTVLGAL